MLPLHLRFHTAMYKTLDPPMKLVTNRLVAVVTPEVQKAAFSWMIERSTTGDGTCWRWIGNGIRMKLAGEKKRKHVKARIRCVVSFFVFCHTNSFWFRFLLTVNKYRQGFFFESYFFWYWWQGFGVCCCNDKLWQLLSKTNIVLIASCAVQMQTTMCNLYPLWKHNFN